MDRSQGAALASVPEELLSRLRSASRGLASEIRSQQRRTLQPERESASGQEWGSLFDELRRRITSLGAPGEGAPEPGDFDERLLPLLDFLFDRYWRVELRSDWNLPARGPVLLVANRAGVLPRDGMMLSHAASRLFDDAARPRILVEEEVVRLPFAEAQFARVGGVPARLDQYEALANAGHSVVHFPEGARGVLHSFRERYRVGDFTRLEVIEAALARGVPIVPVGIVGAEEAAPRLGDARILSRLIAREVRVPVLPMTPTFPLLGPMGLLPLPSRWVIAIGAPVEGGKAEAVADRLRREVQALVERGLDARSSTWL